MPALSQHFRVLSPDLRGHGASGKPPTGFHVARLALDLRNLIDHLSLPVGRIRAIGGSLGCAILWSYSELFTTAAFSHMIFVDQAPQNYTSDGTWGPEFGNRGMNSTSALEGLKGTLRADPDSAYLGTIAACLAYRSHPQPSDQVSAERRMEDEEFFLNEARRGDPLWFGNLMGDHTAGDWRSTIEWAFGGGSGSNTKVFVVASSRSGCFPAAGVMKVVELCNNTNNDKRAGSAAGGVGGGAADGCKAEGVVIDWGGHWCFWEEPEKFNELVLDFLLRRHD